MRNSSKALIAGTLGLVCAGGVYAAAQNVHVMKVALPDGSVAQIHYVGDVAPQIVLAPAAEPVAFADPFAMMDQVAADMDRQQQAMLQQVAAMQAQAARSPQVQTASTNGNAAPQGVYHYSYVSTSGGQGGCTQSYELTSYGNAAPKEVSQQSGDCKGVAPLVKASAPATPAPAPKPTMTSATPAPVRVSRETI